jgi:uncharacterized coiled-coil protein SlyX
MEQLSADCVAFLPTTLALCNQRLSKIEHALLQPTTITLLSEQILSHDRQMEQFASQLSVFEADVRSVRTALCDDFRELEGFLDTDLRGVSDGLQALRTQHETAIASLRSSHDLMQNGLDEIRRVFESQKDLSDKAIEDVRRE